MTTRRAGFWAVVNIAVVIYALLPVLWILSLSLKPTSTVKDGRLIPSSITFANYKGIFTGDVFSSALINSIGNVAGFVGPFAMGWMHDATGSYSTGLLLLAAMGAVAGGVVLWVSRAQLPLGRHNTGGGSPRAVR